MKSQTVRTLFTPPAGTVRSGPRRGFVIAIGVNAHENAAWNLRFAVNDARQAVAVLSARLNATGQFSEVVSVPFVAEVNGPLHATKAFAFSALQADDVALESGPPATVC